MNKYRIKINCILPITIMALFLFTGCTPRNVEPSGVTILLEDNEDCHFPASSYEIDYNSDLTIDIGVKRDSIISHVNYDDYDLSSRLYSDQNYDYFRLSLYHIKYPKLLRMTVAPAYKTMYHYGPNNQLTYEKHENSPHLFQNTQWYESTYEAPGFIATGWNTKADFSGEHVGFGSRIDRRSVSSLDLYLETILTNPIDDFLYYDDNGKIHINGYKKSTDATAKAKGLLIIPAYIDEKPVTHIENGAFGNLDLAKLVLPPTLESVAPGAFSNVTVEDMYLFDSLDDISDASFTRYNINHLHINANTLPHNTGNYFAVLSDKVDYLASVEDTKKLILFAGSSTRFGYDSAALESAFPDYHVVNMGVYAYSNMLIQSEIIKEYIHEGDVVLSSPELDAIDTQFCGRKAFDRTAFCLLESNYDMLANIDISGFTEVFDAYNAYKKMRSETAEKTYDISPAFFDEDGMAADQLTYNKYGDYVVYRQPNKAKLSFGEKRAFYNKEYISQEDIDGLNGVYDDFINRGATIYFSYSPRSNISISKDSNETTIRELDEYLRSNLHATFISSIDDSLMDPLYFNGTDNHLSTEGAGIRTRRVIEYLTPYLKEQ